MITRRCVWIASIACALVVGYGCLDDDSNPADGGSSGPVAVSLDSAMTLLEAAMEPGTGLDSMTYTIAAGGNSVTLIEYGVDPDTTVLENLTFNGDTLSVTFQMNASVGSNDTLVDASGYYVVRSGPGAAVEGSVWEGVRMVVMGQVSDLSDDTYPLLMFYDSTSGKLYIVNQPN